MVKKIRVIDEIDETPDVQQTLFEIAKSIDDDRPFSIGQRRTTQRGKPVNTNSLQVTEIAGVVQMAHGVHIAPAHGNAHFIREFFDFGDVDFHFLKITKKAGKSRPFNTKEMLLLI